MNNETDQKVNGVEHRLLDGYDGAATPPKEFIDQLLQNAPPEIQARAKEFAAQRQANVAKQQQED